MYFTTEYTLNYITLYETMDLHMYRILQVDYNKTKSVRPVFRFIGVTLTHRISILP